jgi:hypothetical protein
MVLLSLTEGRGFVLIHYILGIQEELRGRRSALFSQRCFEQDSRSTTTSTMVSIEPADAAHIITRPTMERLSLQRDGLSSSVLHMASIAVNATCRQPIPHLFAAAGNKRQDIPLGPIHHQSKYPFPLYGYQNHQVGRKVAGFGVRARRESS